MPLDKTELRLQRIEREEAERNSSASRPILVILLLIGGGVGAAFYFTAKQDKPNVVENGTFLPDMLVTKATSARHDLALLDHELLELAREAESKLSKTPGPGNRKRGDGYLRRLDGYRQTGRELEPKLSHEERRVLIATEHAEALIEAFIRGSYDEKTFDKSGIERAKKQVERAQALASGETIESPAVADADHPLAGGLAGQLRSLQQNLATIKQMRGNEAIPEDVAYVPELDGPRKPKPAKRKAADE